MTVKKVIRKKVMKKTAPIKKSAIDIILPDDVNEISEELSEYTWMLYGERKIGKTKLFAEFGKPFYFMFDPKNKGLQLLQVYIPSWLHALKAADLLEQKLKDNWEYCNMVIIDTGFMCYERCYQYKIKQMEQDTAHGQNDHGVAWKEISREFMEFHDKIFKICDEYSLGFGVTAHAEVKNIRRKDGTNYDKLTTQLGAQAFKFYNGLVDIIAYYQYDRKGARILTIQGDSLVEAGARIDEHFMYSNGNKIIDVPMGKSSKQAYINLQNAFNNKLVEPKVKEVKKVATKRK